VFIPLTVGGGVRQPDDMKAVLRAGADKVSVNTAAVVDPDLIARCARRFGRQCVVLAIDAKAHPGRRLHLVRGGGEGRARAHRDRRRRVGPAGTDLGAGEILLTSMDRDGTKDGFDLPLTRAISDAVEVPVIASGGAGEERHMVEAVTEGGASAVLAASIFHRREIEIDRVKQVMEEAGLPVRRVMS
jgi:imidazole glycerol-phosphate synthase subunit HisF